LPYIGDLSPAPGAHDIKYTLPKTGPWAFASRCNTTPLNKGLIMTSTMPSQPANSYRITLNLENPESRMDNVLLNALREQEENEKLRLVSRTQLKEMFNQKKIMIKGQRAKSSSALAKGITYVDILGY
jgi:hypothetical protein